ncbi:hypothetical protein [Lysinibacter sp. HNR]|uniref:hypothetical protein n=1 Tax=Lysinibacter sp. HNR TaxID=3031408 RepID=UPI0024359CDA|nr:hypothetical protein [Lysinibacter sp. HNR]WGD37381.1 hypothetical protein FrondiHNR_00210 [Lysinibacter sp. HNR]
MTPHTPGGQNPTSRLEEIIDSGRSAARNVSLEVDAEEANIAARKPKSLSGHRLVYVLAGVAVVAMVAGILVSRFIISPAQAAADAEAPEAGIITIPIEERVVSNTVTTRGEITFADAVEVKPVTGDLGASPVITGQVPGVGGTLDSGDVALEIAGRPIIVLPGELPAYRSLRAGLSGPDVLQLKQALSALGINPGNVASDVYDAATAAGVRALYERIGYAAPQPGGVAAEGEGSNLVEVARDGVNRAQSTLNQAQAALHLAQAGPTQTEIIEADNAIRAAQRALAVAVAEGGDVAGAEDEVRLQQARRAELNTPKDVSAERQAIADARTALTSAQTNLSEAQTEALTPLPASEVLYLTSLPRRVDSVKAERGSVLEGVAMTVSGATLQLSANVSRADAELLSEGMSAQFPAPGGGNVEATIVSVGPRESTGENAQRETAGRFEVKLSPVNITDEQVEALKGSNVRVTIPVSATDGKVLAVPLAAVQAGPGGESRIEIVTDQKEEKTELVTIETGLAADGFVEVRAPESTLVMQGARVVVGH